MLDKGLLTNICALLLTLTGLLLPGTVGSVVLSVGLFALSGALTNSLAIHMLFERVPGFYGSGVIALHFEEFKVGIKDMVMEQFFSSDNLERFFDTESVMSSGLQQLMPAMIDELDLDRAFDSLSESIMQSSMGGMVGMIGGPKALEGLREPFAQRMREYLRSFAASPAFISALDEKVGAVSRSEAVLSKIEELVDRRLQELTPQQVKEIVQRMIKQHLGWLVVWGGVVGGILGLVFALIGLL
ncbi:hypothetical protein [Pseudohongiella acticola]|jgi:uncharacterized membrane protein YheB (UPF0754 family)|uniref:hypothetical protein n=1 Tax=Pseudohongiella acticola TaxID=1524254 RepID=UPI0030EEFFA3